VNGVEKLKSLRIRLPLVILLAVASAIVIFLLAFRIFMADEVGKNIKDYMDTQRTKSEVVSDIITRHGTDTKSAQIEMEAYAQVENLKVVVRDMEGRELYTAGSILPRLTTMNVSNVVMTGGKASCLYEMSITFTFREMRGRFPSVANARNLAAGLIIACVLFIMAYIHMMIVKPISHLLHRMKSDSPSQAFLPINSRRQDEIGELYRHYNELMTRINTVQKQQLDMMAAISHDVRTPLTSIIGYMKRLINGKATSEEKRMAYYQIVDKKADVIKELMESLSDYVNNSPGVIQPTFEKVPAESFFKKMTMDYEREFSSLGLKFTSKYVSNHARGKKRSSDVTEETICMDARKIRRVLDNLVANAMKHAGPTPAVHVDLRMDEQSAHFSVSDNGKGVPENQLEAIFDKFHTVDAARSIQGSGLGLSICKSIVAAHGGTISATNTKEGFTVSFAIPVTQQPCGKESQ
jgi:signal transduction histidine kinase